MPNGRFAARPKATCQWLTSVPVVEAPASCQKTGPPKTLAPT